MLAHHQTIAVDSTEYLQSLAWLYDSVLANPATELAMATYWLLPRAMEDVVEHDNYWITNFLAATEGFQDVAYILEASRMYHSSNVDDCYEKAETIVSDMMYDFDAEAVEALESGMITSPLYGFDVQSKHAYQHMTEYHALLRQIGIDDTLEAMEYDYDESEIFDIPRQWWNHIGTLVESLPLGRHTVSQYTKVALEYISGTTGNSVADWSWEYAVEMGVDFPYWDQILFMNDIIWEAQSLIDMTQCLLAYLDNHSDLLYEIGINYQRVKEGKLNEIQWSECFKRPLSIYDTQADAEFPRFWRDHDQRQCVVSG